MKRNFSIIILILFSSCGGLDRKTYQTFKKDINENYSINVTAYTVNCFGICDADYKFESINKISNSRNEIFTVYGDDPYEIPTQNIIVKNEKFAYVWLRRIIGVTTDGGETWLVWKGKNRNEMDVTHQIIKNIEIEETGEGKMFLDDYTNKTKSISILQTKDFGKTWQKP